MLARDRTGDRAVFVHAEVRGRFLGAFGRRVGELPFSGDVALGRLLGLLRLADFESMAVHKDHLDLCFFLEDVSISNHKICDFPFSIEPKRPATPKISAGDKVSARSAASGASPASIDFFAALTMSFGVAMPPE